MAVGRAAQTLDSALQVTTRETPESAWEEVSCRGSVGLKCRAHGRGLLVTAEAKYRARR